MAKVLLLDLETAPKIAFIWKFWKENVNPNQVISDGFIMTASMKWLGDDNTFTEVCGFKGVKYDDELLCMLLREMLDKADVVIAHNAKKFDLPTFNARCAFHKIPPPSPYKVIDTLEVARKKFKFDSNKLEYLARYLGCKLKGTHGKFPGFTLWLECLKGNSEAWDEMVEYNKLDVDVLEQVYLRLRPWMDNHPNIAHIQGRAVACPKCGSYHIQKRGVYKTNVGSYQRYYCNACGGWSRERFILVKNDKKLLVNAGVMQ